MQASVLKVVLTGGGTAGHVMPHLALLPLMQSQGWQLSYIGSAGIEKNLIERQTALPFKQIPVGKLRRYFAWQNFSDAWKVLQGCAAAFFYLRRLKPQLIFSKGGFVSVPVALAGWALRIPVVTHESDFTPGLATRLIVPFAQRVLYSFPETGSYLPRRRSLYTGTPIRAELLKGSRAQGLALCGFSHEDQRPVLLVMGGSMGALRLNRAIQEALTLLLPHFRIVHITGKEKGAIAETAGYKSFEFVDAELKDIFSMTDLVLARSGANAIFEFLALRKPMLLVPLEAGSRGDQLHNAQSFAAQGWADLLREREITSEVLVKKLQELWRKREQQIAAQEAQTSSQSVQELILEVLKNAALKTAP